MYMEHYNFSILSNIYFYSAAFALFVIFILLKKRQIQETRYLAALEFAVAIWAVCAGFEVAGTGTEQKLLWSQISYLGIVTSPALFFLFALAFTQKHNFINKKTVAILSIFPMIILFNVFYKNNYTLLWTMIEIGPKYNIAKYYHGPLYWMNTVYSYNLIFISYIMVFKSFFKFPQFYKTQIITLVIATIIPIIGNLMYVLNIDLTLNLDLTPIGMIFTGLIFYIAVTKNKLFDLVPFARHQLVDEMQNGLLAIDDLDRIVDINPVMSNLFNAPAKKLISFQINEKLKSLPELLTIIENEEKDQTIFLNINGDDKYYQVRINRIRQRDQVSFGKLIILDDITPRVVMAKEREELIKELQNAIAQVKQLNGLMPICGKCKKIRDDKGYWHQVEAFVMNHSKAHFTHGICPECRNRLYPEFSKT